MSYPSDEQHREQVLSIMREGTFDPGDAENAANVCHERLGHIVLHPRFWTVWYDRPTYPDGIEDAPLGDDGHPLWMGGIRSSHAYFEPLCVEVEQIARERGFEVKREASD